MKYILKPCAHCGSADIFLRCGSSGSTLWIIDCKGCRSEFTVKRERAGRGFFSNKEDLVEAWNRRAEANK